MCVRRAAGIALPPGDPLPCQGAAHETSGGPHAHKPTGAPAAQGGDGLRQSIPAGPLARGTSLSRPFFSRVGQQARVAPYGCRPPACDRIEVALGSQRRHVSRIHLAAAFRPLAHRRTLPSRTTTDRPHSHPCDSPRTLEIIRADNFLELYTSIERPARRPSGAPDALPAVFPRRASPRSPVRIRPASPCTPGQRGIAPPSSHSPPQPEAP